MVRNLDEKLRELVVNLVGQEARRIKCKRKEIKRYKPRNPPPISIEVLNKTKREIYNLFRGDYDKRVVRKVMFDYLDWQTGFVDESVNPSFQMLKDRIKRGEYDFDFGRYIEI